MARAAAGGNCNPVAVHRDFLTDLDGISVWRTVYLDRHRSLLEMHCALEFGVLLSGAIARVSSGYAATFEPGDAWFHGTCEPHGFEPLTVPSTALNFTALPHVLAGICLREMPDVDWMAPFATRPDARPRVPAQSRRELLDLASRLLAHAAPYQVPSDEHLREHARGARTPRAASSSGIPPPERAAANAPRASIRVRLFLLEMMFQARENWSPPAAHSPHPSAYTHISPIVDMMATSRQPITVADAAVACAMSRNAFNGLFNALMGSTFGRYEMRRRLSGAADDLLHTDDPIKAVATDWGFVDASHFNRRFQEHYGYSPGEYRRRGSARGPSFPAEAR